MEYDQLVLKRLQQEELEILKAVHEFCKMNSIEYSLAYGTLIGAVRHKGFIPWDDDVDLIMRRDMYDKFIRCWLNSQQEEYYLQNDEIEPGYPNNFAKIRKKNTAFIQTDSELTEHKYRTGIFIDVFPLDRVAPAGIKRKIQYASCAINMLMTRNYMSKTPGAIERILFHLPRGFKRMLKEASYRLKTVWNKSNRKNDLQLFWNGTIDDARKYFIPDLCNDYILMPFEDNWFYAFKKYDEYLKEYFGDYMKLPPIGERVNHAPILIDFEHDFEAIEGTRNA